MQKIKVLEKQMEGNYLRIVQKEKLSTTDFRSKGPSKMDEYRSTSRCVYMTFKTLEHNRKILHIPEREKKRSHTRDEESQRFQASQQQH